MTTTSTTIRPLAGAGLALIALLAGLTGCGDKQPPAPPPTPVTVGEVRLQPVPLELQATGTVEPLQTVAVLPQVTGPITKVFFQEGQDVVPGQPLFQIDPRPFQAALQQAEAQVARDRATARNAEADAARYAELVEKEYVTAQQYAQARTSAEAGKATLAASIAAAEQARLDLQYATIRAPIGGRTGALMVRAGNLVRTGQTLPLVTINQIRPILVRFAVPATHLPAIQRFRERGAITVHVVPTGTNSLGTEQTETAGEATEVPTGAPDETSGDSAPAAAGQGTTTSQGGTVGGRAGGGRAGAAADGTGPGSDGTLTFVDNAVDTTTGTILLKGTFANPSGMLWPGEFVNVRMRLTTDTALTVPAAAVVSGQQGNYVFIVLPDGTAQQRPVTVERTQGGLAVIQGEVRPGERVVTDGQLRLRPGAKVQIKGKQGTS
ncbi:MAG TPA: efflux RND transporter periplasmic adaptor subunit [Gemmatimonadales bacterium]|nr:efflux RND transporter periplasmic adaptor subunit [Gemmatimonadales bacterium]